MNWRVRIKNKAFWLMLIPAVLLLIEMFAGLIGFSLDLSDTGEDIIGVVNALFSVLTILGIVNDPTTHGLGDSERAMTYTKPYDDADPDIDPDIDIGAEGSD